MLTQKEIFDTLECADSSTPIDVAALFPEYLQNGKLVLENIAFCCWNYELKNLDFSNCILKNCDFSHTVLMNCVIPEEQCEKVNLLEVTNLKSSIANPNYKMLEVIRDYNFNINHCENWRKYLWQNYPETYNDYKTVSRFAENKYLTRSEQNFIILKPYTEQSDSNNLGWKLHINVDTSEIATGEEVSANLLRLITPILAKYRLPFKVNGHVEEEKCKGHTWEDSQVTIYLESDNKSLIDSDNLQLAMQEIEDELSHTFSEGKKPQCDAKTFSPYFSIRNDYDSWDLKLFPSDVRDAGYISSDVAKISNPLCAPNPFVAILDEEPQEFSLMQHYRSFEPFADREEAFYALQLTLCSYLRQNTLLDTLDVWELKQEETNLFQNCEISESLIKDHAIDMKEALFFSYITYLFIGCHVNNDKSIIPDNNLHSLYPIQDEFSEFLAYVDKTLEHLPVCSESQDVFRYNFSSIENLITQFNEQKSLKSESDPRPH
jgi:hypothetical protein